LVKPLSFVIPVYRTDARPLWMMKLGVWLYDRLSGKYVIKPHRALTAQEVSAALPGIRRDGLVGGVEYYDAQMDDARLCLENVLSAREKGADVANYMEVRSVIKEIGRAAGVRVRDVMTGKTFEVRAKRVVCCAGPWTNPLLEKDPIGIANRVRTTKGVHVVYKKKLSDRAVLLQIKKDRRIFFVIPWMGQSLIGTTDTDYNGSPDDLEVEAEDIRYLMTEAKKAFPNEIFEEKNIVATFAGLRPLVHQRGHPSKVSRKHVIEESPSGVVYVMGGKYTTYRLIAEDCVTKLLGKRAADSSRFYPVYGSGPVPVLAEDEDRKFAVAQGTVAYLRSFYGSRYMDVLQLVQEDPACKEPVCDCSPVIAAQIVYAIRTEMARTADDVIWRRLGLGYQACGTKKCRKAVLKYFS